MADGVIAYRHTCTDIEELERLYDFINKCRHAYYILDAPFVSDAVYDDLFRKAQNTEADQPHWRMSILNKRGWDLSPTEIVGASIKEATDGV